MKMGSFVQKIILIAASLIAAFIVGEMATRVFGFSKTYNSYYRYKDKQLVSLLAAQSDQHGPEMKRDFHLRIFGVEYRTNNFGFRDREFNEKKKDGVLRIACVGDSVTFGYGMPAEKTFPKLLEKKLSDNGISAEVMNLGFPGNDVYGNRRVTETIALQFSPDVFIYQFGLNDFNVLKSGRNVAPTAEAKLSRTGFLKNMLRKSASYLAIAERYNAVMLKAGIKEAPYKDWYYTDSEWQAGLKQLKGIFDLAAAKGLKTVFLYIPYDYQLMNASAKADISAPILKKFCAENNIYYADASTTLKDCLRKGRDPFLDDAHLSKYGHAAVGDVLYGDLISKLGKKLGGDGKAL